jgi:HAMP domain-containing protein
VKLDNLATQAASGERPAASRPLYASLLRTLLRNYIFGSAIAVLGLGSLILVNTLSIPRSELILLIGVLVVSLASMLAFELAAFRRHMRPIAKALLAEQPTESDLEAAYWQTHRFPLLAVKRTFGPHFLGMSVPAVLICMLLISTGYVSMPYHYLMAAGAGALMVASMHAMIEYFMTAIAVRPVLSRLNAIHQARCGRELSLGGQVIVSTRTKFMLGAFLIGTLPLVLFTFATQVRLDGLTAAGNQDAYWQWSAIVLVFGVSFSLFGASLLSRSVQEPIHHIVQAMGEVRGGNLDIRAHDLYADEFSKLAAGFNHMVNSLRERETRNEQLLQSYFFTLAAALDARDAYTAGHSERVAQYAVRIGAAAGWSAEQLDLLRKSALLHDIGKIGVRDAVLLKDGRLTDEEFEQIKQHPALGENILKQIEPADAMSSLLPGVRSHHERYDGKGYPDGLSGTAIPLLGRVIAIADAFDAMTSDRPYRRGMSPEKAVAILQEGKGTQWDPALAELFIRSLKKSETAS